MERSPGDRYQVLLRSLRAGREIRPRAFGRNRFEWHPIARKLLIAILVALALYVVAAGGYRWWRLGHVDAWTGPDTSVTSGQRLEGCDAVALRDYDVAYPLWVRFAGKVYVATGYGRPLPTDLAGRYQITPYQLGKLQLWRILDTPDGRAGIDIVLRFVPEDVGELFKAAPGCS
jgi:hypothetical protein